MRAKERRTGVSLIRAAKELGVTAGKLRSALAEIRCPVCRWTVSWDADMEFQPDGTWKRTGRCGCATGDTA